MDFFQHQDAARSRTKRLVVLFGLAVVCIIGAVYAIVAVAMLFFAESQYGADPVALALRPEVMGAVALGVLGVVGTGSLYKVAQLAAGGGGGVAESLGGRLVASDTADLDERKLLNVVEEMSIASGLPVPPVYLLDGEDGINAFAAGYAPTSAVVGVTRGAVQKLSRDELQGVIAHEFSHILNGDMRLNVRLIGIVHGILVIGLIGYGIVRAVGMGSRSSSRNSKGNPLPLLLIGAGLIVVGYAGTFFGRLIKAAVSRQREFLADAAAVQFTRYPDGLAGALKKIGGYETGSRMNHPQAEQASHLFFGQGLSFSSLFATHPPLEERIAHLDPGWGGAAPGRGVAASSGGDEAVSRLAGATAIDRIGQPTPAHIAYAGQLLARIPLQVHEAARESNGARGIVYALLLQEDPAIRHDQLDRLSTHADRPSYAATQELAPAIDALDEAARLPLVELAMPALRQLTSPQGVKVVQNVDKLIRADDRVELFEWALRRMVLKHLLATFGEAKPVKVRHVTLRPVQDEIGLLLSAVAYAGHADAPAAERAYRAGLGITGLDAPLSPREACTLRAIDRALDELAAAAPLIKKKVLAACATCITTDAAVTIREAELLRAIADALDCPMPPVLPGQALV